MKIIKLTVAILALPILMLAQTQQRMLVDKVVGIVGDNIILMSDVELQYEQYKLEGTEIPNMKCELMNQLLIQKMMLQQAQVDSIVVGEDEVEGELDRRMRYFISMIGSEERLEEYYGKSIIQIKDEFRTDIQEQLLAQKMQQQILDGVSVTPAEVKEFFASIPKDSIPYFNAEVEIGVIVDYPDMSKSMKEAAKLELIEVRRKILDDGFDFGIAATVYSDDPGTRDNGGDLGFFGRGQMVTEFEAEAFSLDPGQVSEVFETKFGFHILKVEERKGNKVRARHILIKPEILTSDLDQAQTKLKEVKRLIETDSITFAQAVAKYSEDEETKNAGGMLVNPQTGNTFWEMDQLDQQVNFVVTNMKVGDISDPTLFVEPDGTQGYRLIYLKSESPPHVANLKDDYYKIKAAASAAKEERMMQDWMEEKIGETYIYIEQSYSKCEVLNNWMKKIETVESTYE